MSERLRVALVFGGRSGEHEVSVVSARSVSGALDRDRYDVVPMAIDRHGLWAVAETAAGVLAQTGGKPDTVPSFEGATRLDPRLLDGSIDVVLPILHGPFGEDGTIQGLCEMLGLPYAGCSWTACAVTMDKTLTKRLLREAGVPTADFVTLSAAAWRMDRSGCEARCLALPLPVFVKPARLGSSVGIGKVKEASGLGRAVDHALVYDDEVIVERGIDGREIEVAVLGGEPAVASVPGEVVPGHEFYDYADKYLDEACRLLAPAPLPAAQSDAVRALALQVFETVGCDAIARVDLFLERGSGRLFVNEVNAMPGFTSISMYPRLLVLSGVAYPEVLDRLVAIALARHARRSALADAALRPLAQRSGATDQ